MAFNKRLFHLGNNVVSLARKIEKEFPEPLPGLHEIGKGNIFREVLTELLDVINQVRLAIQEQEPQEWWDIKVKCNSQEILAIKEQIEVLELNYELSQPKGEN